jgi:hypothetical protein
LSCKFIDEIEHGRPNATIATLSQAARARVHELPLAPGRERKPAAVYDLAMPRDRVSVRSVPHLRGAYYTYTGFIAVSASS